MLEETFKLSRENNKLLKKVNRRQAFGAFLRIFYWVIIIGAGIGIFYFAQPYLDQVSSTYSGFTEKVNTVNSLLGN